MKLTPIKPDSPCMHFISKDGKSFATLFSDDMKIVGSKGIALGVNSYSSQDENPGYGIAFEESISFEHKKPSRLVMLHSGKPVLSFEGVDLKTAESIISGVNSHIHSVVEFHCKAVESIKSTPLEQVLIGFNADGIRNGLERYAYNSDYVSRD